MSAWGATVLISAYALPALLVFGIVFHSPWPRTVKTIAVGMTAALYLVTAVSIPRLLGWPSEAAPPARFRLIAAQVQQPDKATRDPGAIYLWVTDAVDLASAPAPRAYRLPYSGPLHELAVSATAKLQNGMPQLGAINHPEPRDYRMTGAAAHSGPAEIPVRFYDMSDPLFPDK